MQPDRARFMLFLRVLFKYLQVRKQDENYTYERLKLALHECAQRSRRGEVGYERNLTAAMQRTIADIVSEHDLAKAREYTDILIKRHGNNSNNNLGTMASKHSFQQAKKKQSQGLTVRDPNAAAAAPYVSAFSPVGGNYSSY